MKYLVIPFMTLILSCSVNANDKVEKIYDPHLVNILMFSEMAELNKLQPNIEKNLWVKIYKVPDKTPNDCFPESHGICKYVYYIAVSQFDENPIVDAYRLGVFGEIVNYKWTQITELDTAVINIEINEYSKEAITYNKKLKDKVSKYKLLLKPGDITLTKN